MLLLSFFNFWKNNAFASERKDAVTYPQVPPAFCVLFVIANGTARVRRNYNKGN